MNKKDVILCIDDEQIILNSLSKQLIRKFGTRFEYEFAESGEEALEIVEELDEMGQTVVMAISDQIMPGMYGDEFLTKFHESHPKSIKILLTGQAALDSAMNAINKADLYRYLTKPWNEDDFLLTVDRGLQQYYLQDKASILLAEIHHRVKNNLTIISSLLELQVNEFNDPSLKLPFQQSINRVHSIAKVHELIYDSNDMDAVNISKYLGRILPSIQKTLQGDRTIHLHLDVPDYRLDMNQSIPLGLMFNELLTNSVKYAFVNRTEGNIYISMAAVGRELRFIYEDDGNGYATGESFESSTNLGQTLVKLQLQQLECTYTLDTTDKFRLNFQFLANELDQDSHVDSLLSR
ncbi:MAG: response regulator [bacterium]|nr:response regulator [bacterium]